MPLSRRVPYICTLRGSADRVSVPSLNFLGVAGKSTLLNALIGSTLLPSTNVPETARICQIQHSPGLSSQDSTLTYQAVGQAKIVQGAAGIRE